MRDSNSTASAKAWYIGSHKADGRVGYKREDIDVWIARSPRSGWVATDDTTGRITGIPLESLPYEQADYSPEGEWVSKKGD